MKSDPVVRTLADIADVTMGQSPKGETCNPDGIGVPLLNGPTEFGFRHPEPVQFTTDPKRFAEPGDLLFCVRGSTTGRMNWADQQYAIGRGIASIRGKNGFPTSYVRAVIEYRLDSLLLSATGSTFPNVGRSMLTDLSVPDHDVGAAVGIAQMLDTLDEQMWNLKDMNTTLESIAQAIFKSWFIDFDPVHAKAAGREPEGMDAETAALFPSEFEESELGPIPKEWTTSALGNRFDIVMGQSPPSHTYNEEGKGTPFYQGRRDFGARFPSIRVYCTEPTRFARKNDVLLSVRAPVGDINVAMEDCAIGRGVAAIRSDEAPSFALYSIKSLANDFARYESEGTVFGSINKGQLEGLRLISPPDSLVRRFEEIASSVDARIRQNKLSIRTLTALRDTLLPRLISGKLRIPEAEELVEEAVS